MPTILLAVAALSGLDTIIHDSIACPPPVAGEITVCGRNDAPGRYLSPLPFELEPGDKRVQSVSAECNGLFDYDAGGTGSCSASGAGGIYGCGFQKHKRWVLQRAGAHDPRGPYYDRSDK